MNDLDTLRPEVREAINRQDRQEKCDEYCPVCEDRATIRAELLRPAGDLNAARLSSETFEAKYQCMRERAEKAEAELATAQNTINAQQDMMGALKRKLALSEGELAALKTRIAEAPVGVFGLCYNGHEPGFLGFPQAIDNLPRGSMLGKRVRLVVEE